MLRSKVCHFSGRRDLHLLRPLRLQPLQRLSAAPSTPATTATAAITASPSSHATATVAAVKLQPLPQLLRDMKRNAHVDKSHGQNDAFTAMLRREGEYNAGERNTTHCNLIPGNAMQHDGM